MAERRIRTAGRPTYGRPAMRPKPKRSFSFRLGMVPRRIIIAVVAVVLVAMVGRQIFGVHTITVEPASDALKTEVRTIVNSSWWLSNTLTFQTDAFRDKLLAADPAIKDVKVARLWPGGIQVTVTQKQPSLGWMTGNEGHLLDADGTVIGALPAGSKLPVVIDNSNLPVETGKVVVSPRFVSFVTGIARQIPNTGIAPTKYEIKDTTLDLYVSTNKGYQLILDTSRPVGDAMNDLKAILANLKQTGKTPTEYIDLRIAGRAYYK